MNIEWQLVDKPKPNSSEDPRFRWRHYGEVEFSLVLRSEASKTAFQLARYLSHPTAVYFLKQGEWGFDDALETITQGKRYIDVRGDFFSPEDLRLYFEDERLSLPRGYIAAFDYVEKFTS